MDQTTFSIYVGVCFILIGFLFSIFNRNIGQLMSDLYFKWYQIRFPIRMFQIGQLIGGIFLILIGLHLVLNINVNKNILVIAESVATIIVCSLVGGSILFYHRRLGQSTADFYYKLFHIRFNIRACQIVYSILGIITIIFGFLIALHLI